MRFARVMMLFIFYLLGLHILLMGALFIYLFILRRSCTSTGLQMQERNVEVG